MATLKTSVIVQPATQLILGPVGKLEVIAEAPLENARPGIGIVCHPHPLFGGTMGNKVVTTLAKMFRQLGLTTVRFNFRGVGRSEGEFNHGDGELGDLLAVLNWIRQLHPNKPIWLAGFSFGAYIAAKAASQIELQQLITVAPPVENFPMNDLAPIECPWILVQGDQDDVVPPAQVYAWAEKLDPAPIIIRFPTAGHFFHGQLGELKSQIEAALPKI